MTQVVTVSRGHALMVYYVIRIPPELAEAAEQLPYFPLSFLALRLVSRTEPSLSSIYVRYLSIQT